MRIQVRASSQRLKTESETGERRYIRAHKTLTPRVTDFFTDFEEKTDCFAVYLNIGILMKFHGGSLGSITLQQQNRSAQNMKRLTKTLLFASMTAILSWLPLLIVIGYK